MLSFKKENMTPAKARRMLSKTEEVGFINRTPTASYVQKYAHDMMNGNWQSDTGETVKVTKDGKVIDGRHRLLAVCLADVPVKMWVCHDVKEEMFQYIDQGNNRTLQDIMSIEGWSDPRILSVTGKMLWRLDRAGNPYAHAGKFNESDGNIYDWILTVEPDLRREWDSYAPLIKKAYRATNKSIPESLLFYLLYEWKKEDPDAALLFLGYLSEGPLGQPSHGAMAFFKAYAAEVQLAQKDGKLAGKGRHADMKEVLLIAAQYAWSCVTENRRVLTLNGFKSGLGRLKAA